MSAKKSPHYPQQLEAWQAYQHMIRMWHNPDILISNGDLIDGRQHKQGGAELITADRNVQCEMALNCIFPWHAKRILMTYGTTYHVGDQAEDFEYQICNMLKAKHYKARIEGKLFIKVEGLTIDARHFVGRSVIPYGKAAPLMRDMMWNILKSAEEEEPRADILIRSHVHYYLYIEENGKVMITTPALQLARGRFGSRLCVGRVDWGAIRLTLDKGKIIGKDIYIWKLRANKAKVIKIR